MTKEKQGRTPLKLDDLSRVEFFLRAPFVAINLLLLVAFNEKFGFMDEETGDLFINPIAFYKLYIESE